MDRLNCQGCGYPLRPLADGHVIDLADDPVDRIRPEMWGNPAARRPLLVPTRPLRAEGCGYPLRPCGSGFVIDLPSSPLRSARPDLRKEPLLIKLSPEQWRVLNYLHQHKLHAVRPKYEHVRRSQKIYAADLTHLNTHELVTVYLGDDGGYALTSLPESVLKQHARLGLSAAGLRRVLGDQGNQIRYTLGEHDKPIRLAKLFAGNTAAMDDAAKQQSRGLISVELPGAGEFDLTSGMTELTFKLGYVLRVQLTAKGREYLPY